MNKSVPALCRNLDMLGIMALVVAAACLGIAVTAEEIAKQGIWLGQFAWAIKASIAFFATSRITEIAINVNAEPRSKRASEQTPAVSS